MLQSGNDSLITVKGNQPTLFEPLRTPFEQASPASLDRQTEQTRDRQTQRTVSVLDTVVGLDPQWVGVQRLVQMERVGTRSNQPDTETMFYISSLRLDAAGFAQRSRQHWHIEHRLHWVKDVVLKEDQAPLGDSHALTNFAIVRTIALNLFRQHGFDSCKFSQTSGSCPFLVIQVGALTIVGLTLTHTNPVELIQHLLPNQTDLSLQNWSLDPTAQQVTLHLTSTQAVAHCPLCHDPTQRIHSRYERTLKDLPVVECRLTIILAVCKFFCLNDTCPRRIFTERLPAVAAAWARRTTRLTDRLKAIGLALGGAAAARLSHQMGYDYSRNAILRLLSSLPLPTLPTPRILGVDDFALRKGHRYGTILVDLEQHQPIALLPDRTAETLAAWLQAHPGVEILSHDRSKAYKLGMSQGAPNAIQVAARFHLLQNLEETLETILKGQTQVLQRVEKAQLQASGLAVPPPLALPDAPESFKTMNRTRRLEKYEQTHALRQQGYAIPDIAHHLGLGERTVYTYLSASTFPELQPTIRRRGSGLTAYKPYLQQQWNLGYQQTKALFEDIQQQGYQGSYPTVARFTQQLRRL